MKTKKYLDDLTYKVIGAAIEVHKHLGPGLLESVYHSCMFEELRERNIWFQSQLIVNVNFKNTTLDTNLRCDFLVEEYLVVELKSVEAIAPIHQAQVITYMKLLAVPKGLLLNFNTVNIFKNGQQTFVNQLFTQLPNE